MQKEQMQVLLISRKWPPAVGGMETYSWELSQELKRISSVNLNVRFLPGRKDGRPPHAIALAWFIISTAWFLFRNKNKYDVVHFGDMVQIGLACVSRWRSPDARNVIALHGLDVIYGRRTGLLPGIYRRYLDWARRRDCVDCFIANSRNTARLLREQAFKSIAVVPLGVRLVDDHERPAIDAIPEDRFVLFFGRVFRRKGPRWFAEHVLPLLPADVKLTVVGTVWDTDDGEYLEQNSRVRMPGAYPVDISRDEFEAMKRRAVAIVMPNVKNPDGRDVEGFGLTALEAADHGAPLVAADLEGIRDAVLDGQTGFLVAPEDEKAWANKIQGLLHWSREQRQQFAATSVAALRQHYSWARVAADTVAVYENSKASIQES
ncbi:MAG: glycosyltransferase family 4 protein [Woeseiaceae bacterium]